MVKVATKVIGACIVLMMEQYKKHNGFTLEGVLFTKEEIITRANKLFPMNAEVKVDDMKPSSLREKCLNKGSEDSLAEYYRLCSPDDDNFSDLDETFENNEVVAVLDFYLPNQFLDTKQFTNDYFQFIKGKNSPLQERTITDPRKAIWIATATLTYNEYLRTKSTDLSRYTFRIKSIDNLARLFIPNPADSGYSTSITQCTRDSYRPINPFLIDVNEKRRISQLGEVECIRPDNLPLDFMVNTISGTVPVKTLVAFIDNEYASFVEKREEQIVEVIESQDECCMVEYGKKHFLKDVYIDEEDYEKLIALIRRKRNVILQGAPGVGKTYCAKKLAYAIMGEKTEQRVLYVQFHQGYSYEDFVEGYRPKENGYALEKGVFYNFCQTAEADSEHKFFFIIDEMNRGNLSKIFGELFTLLEADKRGEKIKLVYSGDNFTIPENVYIIGLMNTADRSLAMIDYALRRRFGFFTMKPGFDTDGFKKYMKRVDCSQFGKLIEQVKKLNEEIAKDDALGEGFCIGHSFFCKLDESNTLDELKSVVENEIVPLLEEYWFDEHEQVKKWNGNLLEVLQ